ncbi:MULTISPECIES: AtpZ/AtpI family protein [unclassified Phenylobacterium]|uniref:AtpZ/AtpI family protein n=1 Tax=unclassified Phenylobacterium TaxID=2640670 RepID=UPI002263EDEB|nr:MULTISPECIES: AtpZ/AtpI family protein [unclassified Phenylobacterium]MBS0489758.1 AtpZ/AtpI family protein [Pseudomonadota bacterium]MCX7588176.1 AtpZ/AtpI family protein [Phenylobacterium sp. 58.2.17]WGU41131.1 AtpZ/AtpI family protein [Phenylobacterium sp. NIBR 498073]
MPHPDNSRDEAIRRLDERAAALEERTTQTPRDYGSKAAGYGYRLMGVLIGGVFVGLGFGAGADVVLKTAPWGMIIGVLVGFGVSIWMAVRSAQRMTAEAAREWGPVQDLPPDDEDD